MSQEIEIGIIGGSGLYRLLDDATTHVIDTPHGEPSAAVTVATWGGRRVGFLPRHGVKHTISPHRINYRANIWALHHLGARRVLAPCAVGSLRAEQRPGDVVICDQFVDRTSTRPDTFFDDGAVAHLPAAHPYCPELRREAAAAARAAGMTVHDQGTIVVIQGPRFSTTAESRWFAAMGWDVVGMTQYPEVVLAAELGMCYATMALITDYDSGLSHDPSVEPVTQEAVMEVFATRTDQLRSALRTTVEGLAMERRCGCAGRAPSPLGH